MATRHRTHFIQHGTHAQPSESLREDGQLGTERGISAKERGNIKAGSGQGGPNFGPADPLQQARQAVRFLQLRVD
jgi:hypothetical protein